MKIKKEIVLFVASGSIVNISDFSIYFALFHFLPYSIAKAISFTCGGIVGYLLSKYWTFKYKKSSKLEVCRYAIINFLALGINVTTNQGVLNMWPGAIFPALIAASTLTALFTFICFKWWVFKS